MRILARGVFPIGLVLALLASVFGANRLGAQTPSVQQLIDQLASKNEQTMMTAYEALLKQGAQVLPALVETLDKRRECQVQFVASGVIRKIEPNHSRIEPALAVLARGECSGNSEQDFVLRQESAFALSYTPSGITLLGDMVPHKDVLTRRRVAFAFEDLTEKIELTADEFKAVATLVEPTAQALPKLAPFLSDGDERVRCVTLEALEQARDSRHAAISGAAKGILAGKKVSCGR